MSLSRKAMLVCIVAGWLLATPVLAEAPTATKNDQQSQQQTEEKRKTLMADATSAISETQNALRFLDDGKTKQALAALERATGKLDIILARDASLTLAPAGVSVVTTELQGGIDVVKPLRKQIEELMDQGRIQEARRLLKGLASETVVTVANIPLATYPDAIRHAAKLVDDGKTEDAKRVLQTALNTQVLTETVIPLPVAYAADALQQAKTLAEKKDRTAQDNSNLQAALDRGRTQLELAQALGYGTKVDFDRMYQQLADVRDKTSDGHSGTGFFAKIEESMAKLMKSASPPKK